MSLENSVLSLLQELIMAKNAPKSLKSPYLIRASSHLEVAILKYWKLPMKQKFFRHKAN